MITRLLIAFEDFLGSSIAPQVMSPWLAVRHLMVQGGEILGWAITEGAARCPRPANFRPLLLSFLQTTPRKFNHTFCFLAFMFISVMIVVACLQKRVVIMVMIV